MAIEVLTSHQDYEQFIVDLQKEGARQLPIGSDHCPWHPDRKIGFIGEWHYEENEKSLFAITLLRCTQCGKVFYLDGVQEENNIA